MDAQALLNGWCERGSTGAHLRLVDVDEAIYHRRIGQVRERPNLQQNCQSGERGCEGLRQSARASAREQQLPLVVVLLGPLSSRLLTCGERHRQEATAVANCQICIEYALGKRCDALASLTASARRASIECAHALPMLRARCEDPHARAIRRRKSSIQMVC